MSVQCDFCSFRVSRRNAHQRRAMHSPKFRAVTAIKNESTNNQRVPCMSKRTGPSHQVYSELQEGTFGLLDSDANRAGAEGYDLWTYNSDPFTSTLSKHFIAMPWHASAFAVDSTLTLSAAYIQSNYEGRLFFLHTAWIMRYEPFMQTLHACECNTPKGNA
ncbi:hypothetical protein BKA93DRAFT_762117 [Sparassis latifolia]